MDNLNDFKTKARALKKAKEGRMLSGVCAGIASTFQIDTNMVRLLFTGLTLINGLGLFIYLFLHFYLQEEEQ